MKPIKQNLEGRIKNLVSSFRMQKKAKRFLSSFGQIVSLFFYFNFKEIFMKELNQFELENVAGGDDFARRVGHAVGDFFQSIWG